MSKSNAHFDTVELRLRLAAAYQKTFHGKFLSIGHEVGQSFASLSDVAGAVGNF